MKKLLFFLLTFFLTFSVSYAENTEKEIDNTICNGTEKIGVRYYGVDKDIWQISLSFSDGYTGNKELALKHGFQDYPEIIEFIQKLDEKGMFPCEEVSEFYISDIELSPDKKHYIIGYYYTNKDDNKKYSVILKDDKIVKKYSISGIEIYAKDYVTPEVFAEYYEEGEKRDYQESSFVKLSRYNDDYIFFNGHFSELRQIYNYCKIPYEGIFVNGKILFCGDEYNKVHSLDIFLEQLDLDKYFSKNLKGQDTFGIYTIPETVKNNIKNTLETRKQSILRNERSLYKALEKYFDEYENKNNKKITKEQYVKYELYNYLYGKIKILELTQ